MLALGTQTGHVQIWDPLSEKKLCDLRGHRGRVGETLTPPSLSLPFYLRTPCILSTSISSPFVTVPFSPSCSLSSLALTYLHPMFVKLKVKTAIVWA